MEGGAVCGISGGRSIVTGLNQGDKEGKGLRNLLEEH